MEYWVEISKYAGMREDLVQAGGGNSAYKISKDKMVIKASGFQLADVTTKTGYALVNPLIVKEAFLYCDNLDDINEEKSKRILSEAFIEGNRPSIETFLHSISGRYSLHTHPIVVNAVACQKNGSKIFKELYPDALIVPYATPGVELAKAYFRAYKEYKSLNEIEPSVVFLLNHGLIVSAETSDKIIALTEAVVKKLEDYLQVDMSSYHCISKLMLLYNDGIIWRVSDENILSSYRKIGAAWNHYFCPDCVVFLGKKMYEIKTSEIDRNDYESFIEKNGYPVVIFYKDNIYIHADSVKKALEIQSVLGFSAQVMALNINKECNLLSESEKNFLLNWDAEKYRRNMI
ncbi:MAG: class II aldolase [Lachnospiraceae bacterium]|jgi:ribulose-5-phosphate 4-epimerase/fuculose-1-phosphate aldolase|nr:class II aldolase [Lachnospiraceae bacterium]